jgi:hypothetical protein
LKNSGGSTVISTGGISATDGSNLLFSASILTMSLFLFSLAIFVIVAIKSKSIKSFQSQISIFVGVYVVGEILELNGIQNVTWLPVDLGSQIHVAATLIVVTVLWSRLFYSTRIVKKLVDHDESANQTG